ncbi:DDE-domain-containing protein, partial [Dendrothele bispora CBS 962.96]
MYWTHALDRSRARAVNVYNHEHYFNLLEKVLEGNGGDDVILDELKYGADESGLQKGVGLKTRAFGAKGRKIQHQQRSGDRENITVIVAICADGTSTTPAVIFKGEGLGYQKKGYTNGVIGRAWLELFSKETQAKANGRRRLLLVDGHNSHYTRDFLQYAREKKIEVLSYPSHSTHVYQGLDVVIFSVLQRNWTRVRDEWERNGHTVDKTNFLSVYASAHTASLTTENIKAAFRKTGVVPFDRGVVTAEMMAPSTTSSIYSTAPIQQDSPVKCMSGMVMD